MPTFNQILRVNRSSKKYKIFKPAISGSPQKKGYCLFVAIRSPKKPNSARRKVAKVFLSSNYKVYIAIQGIGHNLQRYSVLLIRGGRRRDLPGVRYVPIRGKFDLPPLLHASGRSKWGIKKLWEEKRKKLRQLRVIQKTAEEIKKLKRTKLKKFLMLRSLKRKEMKRKIKFERRRKNRIKRKINFSSKRNRFIYNYVKYTRMNIKKYL